MASEDVGEGDGADERGSGRFIVCQGRASLLSVFNEALLSTLIKFQI